MKSEKTNKIFRWRSCWKGIGKYVEEREGDFVKVGPRISQLNNTAVKYVVVVSQVSQSFWGGLGIRSITGYGNSLPSGGSYARLPPLQFKKEEYWRCDEERRMMFSRKVFCGATSPRRPPGMPRECRACAACASRVRHVYVTSASAAPARARHTLCNKRALDALSAFLYTSPQLLTTI